MGSRDDQERELRRQQIIDGALAVFSARGFDKATNQEIAEAAGIGSPGLIYHYFDSKADLLHQVVASRAPGLKDALADDKLAGLAPLDALSLIGSTFLGIIMDPVNIRLFRLILSASLRDPALADDWQRWGYGPLRGALIHYLEARMRSGEFRQMDLAAAADCFLGPFIFHVLVNEVFRRPDPQRLDAETMVADTVTVFLQGLEAK
jgi:AcrR family transcriptional regulator